MTSNIIGTKIYDKVFYINLDRRPDRRKNMENIIKNLGYENITQRIQAIDGKNLDFDNMDQNIITFNGILDAQDKELIVGIPLTKGAIGCAMSHRNVWEIIAYDNSIQSALILEDDINVDKNYHDKIRSYLPYIPKDFEILFLGYSPATIKYNNEQFNDLFIKCDKAYGLFGYILTKKGAQKLLKLFPITLQIDTEMHKMYPYMKAYVIKPKYRIIFSEPSEDFKGFGTDIQIREGFLGNFYNYDSPVDKLMYILFVVLIIIICVMIVLIVYVNFYHK